MTNPALLQAFRDACQPLLDLLGSVQEKGAVASHTPAKAPEDMAWDGDGARKRLAEWASSDGSGDNDKIDWAKYRTGFAWYDEDEPELTSSYKLPHHDIVDGSFVVVWNGVSAAGAACQGSRGGVDVPDDDMDGVKAHLAGHYGQFDKVPPWEQEKSASPEAVEYIRQLRGGDIPIEEALANLGVLVELGKVGRVLSAKNEQALRSAVDAAEEAIARIRSVLDQLGEASRQKRNPEMRPVLKVEEDGAWSVFAPILKVNSERRVVTGHVLAANTVDYQDDYVEPDEIWKAMEKYMIAFQQLDVMHNEVINPLLRVVECYQAPVDFELGEQPVGAGDWIMSVKVMDEEVWRQVESGELRGFSIMGRGLRIPVKELPAGVEVLASATPP